MSLAQTWNQLTILTWRSITIFCEVTIFIGSTVFRIRIAFCAWANLPTGLRLVFCSWNVSVCTHCEHCFIMARLDLWGKNPGRLAGFCKFSRCHSRVNDWETLTATFELAFHWAFCRAKVRSKSRVKSKSKVISLSKSLRPNLWPKYSLRLSAALGLNLTTVTSSSDRTIGQPMCTFISFKS